MASRISDPHEDGQIMKISQSLYQTGEQPNRMHRKAVLATLCAAQFMMVSAVTLTMITLPTIRRKFDIMEADIHWIMTAYGISFGCLLLVGGAVADRFGRRLVFVVGLAAFTVASMLCALATGFGQLVIARALQGSSAALVIPAALGLLGNIFHEDDDRMQALGIWSMVGASGAVMGNVLGGLLTQMIDWYAVFLVNLPVGILLIMSAFRVLPFQAGAKDNKIDVLGATLIIGALFCLLIAISQISRLAITVWPSLSAMTAGLVLGAAFIWLQLRRSYALIPFGVLQNRAALSFAVIVMTGLSYGPFLAMTVYFQEVMFFSPLQSGMAITPWAISIVVFSKLLSRIRLGIPVRMIIAIGFLAMALGTAGVIASLDPSIKLRYGLFPAQVLLGIGNAFSFFGTSVMAMSSFPGTRQGLAAGLLSSSQQIGNAMTIAAFSALSFLYSGPLIGTFDWSIFEGVSSGPKHALAYCIGAGLVTAAFSILVLPGRTLTIAEQE